MSDWMNKLKEEVDKKVENQEKEEEYQIIIQDKISRTIKEIYDFIENDLRYKTLNEFNNEVLRESQIKFDFNFPSGFVNDGKIQFGLGRFSYLLTYDSKKDEIKAEMTRFVPAEQRIRNQPTIHRFSRRARLAPKMPAPRSKYIPVDNGAYDLIIKTDGKQIIIEQEGRRSIEENVEAIIQKLVSNIYTVFTLQQSKKRLY